MNPSTELVTISFGWLHAGSPDIAPTRGTGMGLTGPEAAARYMAVVKAVERLPHQPKAWAYYSLVDGKRPGDAEWEARTICLNVREALRWEDPKSWESDPEKPDQKRAVLQFIVGAVPSKRAVIDQDLAAIAGVSDRSSLRATRPWGQYRQAINRVFDSWDKDILEAVSFAVERKAA